MGVVVVVAGLYFPLNDVAKAMKLNEDNTQFYEKIYQRIIYKNKRRQFCGIIIIIFFILKKLIHSIIL